MEMQEHQILWKQLALFRELHSTALGKAMEQSIEALAAEIYALGGDFGLALKDLVLRSETLCVRQPELFAAGALQRQLDRELELLSKLSHWRREEFPIWDTTPQCFGELYPVFLRELPTQGFGVFRAYHMFTLEENGALRPVLFPDPQRLGLLYGYERQREPVIQNTLALLAGRQAQHVLLYGDAGTGKSSTVKGIANEYRAQGLRLIEAPKQRLAQLPQLLERLGSSSLKFIIFIDDLSFERTDDNFAALKAVLEGGAGGYARNYVVYATGNRRHLVKETMQDRSGEEIHVNDALQEMLSLSARFGLSVTFQRPEKEEYLALVRALARERGLAAEDRALAAAAERAALRRNGRTPRLAKQVVEGFMTEPACGDACNL
jgi:predicted AAA+ superfamily ATPase